MGTDAWGSGGGSADATGAGVGWPLGDRFRLGVVAVSTGVVAGAAEFMHTRPGLLPGFVGQWHAALLVALAGAYVYALPAVLDYGLRESAGAMLVALVVGLAVCILAWVGPVLLYPPGARDVLLDRLLHQAVARVALTYLTFFMGGYLAAASAGGYLDL